MSNDESPRWRQTPISPVDRWQEIVETSHDGLALVDREWVLGFVSDQFAAVVGAPPDSLLGDPLHHHVHRLAPALDRLTSAVTKGDTVRFEVTQPSADQVDRWIRFTFVPRSINEGGVGTIVLASDVSATRNAQLARRNAQLRLTAVQEEQHREIAQEIHDGPVQLLAALALRLTTRDGTELPGSDRHLLREAVETASTEFRRILADFIPRADESPGQLLLRWSAPLLAGSPSDLVVVDESTTPPTRPTMEALFVFLHEVIVAGLTQGVSRRLHATITQHEGRHGLRIVVPNSRSERIETGYLPAQVRAAVVYAESLGGWFEHEMVDDETRVVTVAIQPVGERTVEPSLAPTRARAPHHAVHTVDAASQTLTEEEWESLAKASHEGLMEIDADLKVTFVNEAYVAAMKRPMAELIGSHLSDVFAPDDYQRLRREVDAVRSGQARRFEWKRGNAIGEPRWTQVSASPRRDASGGFAGALLVTLDNTELHLTQDLNDAVSSQIDNARRLAVREMTQQLQSGPLQSLESVSSRLERFDGRGESEPLRRIKTELHRSIVQLRSSVEQLNEPLVIDDEWEREHREVGLTG